jgi:S-DNA-T family DNA segregation ATPase FtsK/SpoIIIE
LKAELGSVALFAFALFSLFAIWTYAPQDPGFFSSSNAPIQNACGKVGAYLASLMLQCFGLGSFVLPAAIGFVSASLYKREGWVRIVGTLGAMTTAVISLTVFLSIQWKYWPYSGSLLLTGGAFGVWLTEILLRPFNSFGSSLVSLLIFCLAIAWSSDSQEPLESLTCRGHRSRVFPGNASHSLDSNPGGNNLAPLGTSRSKVC